MERRKRNIVVALIAVIIAVAILSSFGLGIFAPDTAKIILPTAEPSGLPAGEGDEDLVRVEVTPQTVQSVIATLNRPESYGRAVTITDIWGEEEDARGVTQVQVWVDGGWTRTDAVWPGGTVRHSIVGDGQLWIWYGGGQEVWNGPADDGSADLEGQRIPSYETVLELEQASISAAEYQALDGLGCIYVETAPDSSGLVERYWVDDDSGLLVRAEQLREGEVVYRMTASALERPAPSDASFTLPDGTVLHTVGGTLTPDPDPAAG